jgi:hypothetical protein
MEINDDLRRDYGLGNSSKPTGKPKVVAKAGTICPYCLSDTTFIIEVEVDNGYLIGGKGIGVYVGCAACPWASPMLSYATGDRPGSAGDETPQKVPSGGAVPRTD